MCKKGGRFGLKKNELKKKKEERERKKKRKEKDQKDQKTRKKNRTMEKEKERSDEEREKKIVRWVFVSKNSETCQDSHWLKTKKKKKS